jgi:hypothetical protein
VGGGDAIEETDALLQAKFAELDAEISHYPSPIARCDVQLTKLIEQRAEVLGHQRQFRQLAAAAPVAGELAGACLEMLSAEVYDSPEVGQLRRRLDALSSGAR